MVFQNYYLYMIFRLQICETVANITPAMHTLTRGAVCGMNYKEDSLNLSVQVVQNECKHAMRH